MATNQDLTPIIRGDTVVLIITIVDENQVPIDITGDTLWFTMKLCQDDDDVDAALQHSELVPAGAPATAGQHTLTVPNSLTQPLVTGKYFYDVQWVDPTPTPDQITTLLYGVVEVLADITQSV